MGKFSEHESQSYRRPAEQNTNASTHLEQTLDGMKIKMEEPEQVARNQTHEGSGKYFNFPSPPVANIGRQLEQYERIQDDDQDSGDVEEMARTRWKISKRR